MKVNKEETELTVFKVGEDFFTDDYDESLNPDYKEAISILGKSEEIFGTDTESSINDCVTEDGEIILDNSDGYPFNEFVRMLYEYKVNYKSINEDVDINFLSGILEVNLDGSAFKLINYDSGSGYEIYLFTKDFMNKFSEITGMKFTIE